MPRDVTTNSHTHHANTQQNECRAGKRRGPPVAWPAVGWAAVGWTAVGWTAVGAAADAAARGLPAARGGLEPVRVRNKPTSAPLGHPDRTRGRNWDHVYLVNHTHQGPSRAGVRRCAPSARRLSPTSHEQQPRVLAETPWSPGTSRRAEALQPCWSTGEKSMLDKMLLDKDEHGPRAVPRSRTTRLPQRERPGPPAGRAALPALPAGRSRRADGGPAQHGQQGQHGGGARPR